MLVGRKVRKEKVKATCFRGAEKEIGKEEERDEEGKWMGKEISQEDNISKLAVDGNVSGSLECWRVVD